MSSSNPMNTGADAAGTMNIERVSAESIDHQFTAKALIGKDVYDNQNKKVGEVRDVVLDTSMAPQLATSLAARSAEKNRNSSSDMNTSGSGTMPSANGTSGSTGSSSSNMETAANPMGSGPAAIVSYGGFMGAGGTLFRIPLSQLRYDSSNNHITLNVSDSELSSLKNSKVSRGAAE